jgi:hypothetical protein
MWGASDLARDGGTDRELPLATKYTPWVDLSSRKSSCTGADGCVRLEYMVSMRGSTPRCIGHCVTQHGQHLKARICLVVALQLPPFQEIVGATSVDEDCDQHLDNATLLCYFQNLHVATLLYYFQNLHGETLLC